MVVWNEQDRLGEIVDDARRLFGSDRFRGVPSGRVVLAYFEAVAGDRSVAADALPALGRVVGDHAARPQLAHGSGLAVPHGRGPRGRRFGGDVARTGPARTRRAASSPRRGRSPWACWACGSPRWRSCSAAGRRPPTSSTAPRPTTGVCRTGATWSSARTSAAGWRPPQGRADAAALLGAAASEAEALGMARVARLAREAGASGAVRSRLTPTTRRRHPGSSVARARCGSCASAASTLGCATRRGWRTSPCCWPARASRSMSPSSWVRRRPSARRAPARRCSTRRRSPPTAPGCGSSPPRRTTPTRPATPPLPPGRGPSARRSPTSSRPTSASAERPARRRTGSSGPARPSDGGSTPRSKRIEAEHPSAGRHLRRSVETGAFCAVRPRRTRALGDLSRLPLPSRRDAASRA